MPACAGVILSVGGSTSAFFNLGPSQALASSLTTTNSYSDVSFFASLFNAGTGSASGTAFLTTSLGPGATTANLVDSAPFTIAPGASDIELLVEQSLSPGTYYLVLAGISASGDFGWLFTPFPALVAGPGVTEGQRYYADPAFNSSTKFNTSFPPGSTFLNLDSPSDRLLLDVIAADVPEPSTLFLSCFVLLAFVSKRRRLSTP